MKLYIVKLRFRFPAWDERDGLEYEVFAKSKSEAGKRARDKAHDEGHFGRLYATAKEGQQP